MSSDSIASTRTVAPHLVRPAGPALAPKRRGRPAPQPSRTYAPGFFTAGLWPHSSWPYVGWKPMTLSDAELLAAKRSANSQAVSIAAVAAGRLSSGVMLPGTSDTAPDIVAKLRNWRGNK